MLRKMFSLGALVVVAVTFGVGNASAKPKYTDTKPTGQANGWEGFSDGRFMHGGGSGTDGFSDGR
jgi:hypothetical protein